MILTFSTFFQKFSMLEKENQELKLIFKNYPLLVPNIIEIDTTPENELYSLKSKNPFFMNSKLFTNQPRTE
jgi:hypothetical protein